MKRKDTSPTFILAHWFRTQIQGDEWSYNHPTCRMLLKQAKDLVNPTGDGNPLDTNDVKRAILAVTDHMRQSKPHWKPNNLYVIQWQTKDGKTFFDAANEIPPMPPIYEKVSVLAWLDRYGDRALGSAKAAELREAIG